MKPFRHKILAALLAAVFAIGLPIEAFATIKLSARVRNAMLDAIESTIGTSAHIQIWSGSAPTDCTSTATGTKLADFALASDWATAASAGSKAFSTISSTTGLAAGTAGYYRLVDSTNPTTSCDEQGSITATGGGGDMTIDNTSIASGQTVNITGWTWTQPG
jgi:hypothetical protein